MNIEVPYTDLSMQLAPIREDLIRTFQSVLDSGQYVLGAELECFEGKFAAYCGAGYAVGVASGTAALFLSLRALEVGTGDEVVTSPHSYFATAAAVALTGAKPVFVDIGNDLNIDTELLEGAINGNTKVIIPVHIAGRPARMDRIQKIAKKCSLHILEDAAQSVGAMYKNQRVGSFGSAAGFSLHPLKNLFACGDGGMVTVSDERLQKALFAQRNHGHSSRDQVDFWSYNERLDELQAALLNVMIGSLDEWISRRREKAFYYNEALRDFVEVPEEGDDEFCVFQTYVIQCDRRDELQLFLGERGIVALVHYPRPIHLQPPAAALGYGEGDFPNCERIAGRILSLPLFPCISEAQQNQVIEAVRCFYD